VPERGYRFAASVRRTEESPPLLEKASGSLANSQWNRNGDATTAEEELTRSFEPFATHPMPLIERRNHAALGRLPAARDRPRGAGEAFRRAETLVRELASNISDPAPRRVFLEMAAVREVIAGASG
jgi:hypothetical protein